MLRFLLICLGFMPVLQAKASSNDSIPYLIVLGVAQDGGYPHIGCEKMCCKAAWGNDSSIYVVSLALVSPAEGKWWLFEATPDIKRQLHLFARLTDRRYAYLPDGIFLTHAHIGHYTGLMELGREALNARKTRVYALPKMKLFLENNGPWSQLVRLQNIEIQQMETDSLTLISEKVRVRAFAVPHRDEYSETAGFDIESSGRRYAFIPDIDKWEKWDRSIVELVKRSDLAFLDATFFSGEELPNRNIREIPHPFVSETMQLFENEALATKRKICFIHFNHTNPLIWDPARRLATIQKGFSVAVQGEVRQ